MQLMTSEEPRRFAQIWPSASTGEWVVREGTLGRAGKLRETGLSPDSMPIEQRAAPYRAKGFEEVDAEAYDDVLVQFPMRNSAYDRRLIERATTWVDGFLDERGLGLVDGCDRGKRDSDGRIIINILAQALDGEMGAVAAMAALRKGAADASRATIAYRGADDEE